MRRGEAEAVHTCQDLSVGSTAHLSQTTQFKPSRTRLSSTTSMTGNLATFGEHADLGAAALGGGQLRDHVGEVLADFAGRVGAEPEIGGGHLEWERSIRSSN
jgi:uncharacterized membrane protein YoaK (UPF0700 family)